MLNLSRQHQIYIALTLVALMILTRGHHFASLHELPAASWAVFFLAGVYLRSAWPLLGFFALSWSLDFMAYTWGGTDNFCLTPAYVFLLPAYASLWLAGRWYANRHCYALRTFMPLSLSMVSGLVFCELFSSGGFYFFSGRFADTHWIEYAERTYVYFPMFLESFLFYAGLALAIHLVFAVVKQGVQRNTVNG